MVLVAWFKEIKIRGIHGVHGVISGFVDHFRQWLSDLLSCADPSLPTKGSLLPYSELSRTYTKMRSEASLLFRVVESSGMLKSVFETTKVNLDTLSVDDAINFASKLSLPSNHSTGEEITERHILDDLESSKQRLLTTSGYLRCVQVGS